SRYNWNNLLNVKTPYAEDKELSEEELEIAWAQAYEIYQEYTSYPVRKEAWFPVSIPLKRADADGKGAYITFSILVMKDFSAEGKKQFFKDYTEAWNLMDSGLPVKK
ncbi:MAG: hypothetical protein IJY28_07915, partial [Clostridia bacterium]|nr:hypothetical protein [Clostridia bacterium]